MAKKLAWTTSATSGSLMAATTVWWYTLAAHATPTAISAGMPPRELVLDFTGVAAWARPLCLRTSPSRWTTPSGATMYVQSYM